MKKKSPICCQWQFKIGLKKVVATLEEGKEKTHCHKWHYVSLLGKIFKKEKRNINDHGMDVHIIMVI